jgi:hypothetical protein
MIVSINQPAYLPWLGYFHRIAISDLHIVLDHVQFAKNSVVNRNKIRTPQGSCWLTVPLKTKGRFGALAIQDVEIADEQPWRKKHWQSLKTNYAKAPFFAEHAPFFEAIYAKPWSKLSELMRAINDYLLHALGIRTPLRYSSQMVPRGKKEELVLNLCKEAGATTYVSGPFGRDYLDASAFAKEGIAVFFHDYTHPHYAQIFPNFEPFMSVLDLLFNHGPESLRLLSAGQEAPLK